MQSKELTALLTQLSEVHKAIHEAFRGLPDGSSTAHPVLYQATSAAASAVSNAYVSFTVLRAVLAQDSDPTPKGV